MKKACYYCMGLLLYGVVCKGSEREKRDTLPGLTPLKSQIQALDPTPTIKEKLQSLKPEKPEGIRQILSTGKFSLSNEGQVERDYFSSGYYYLNSFNVGGTVQVAKIPLAIEYLHQDYFYPQLYYKNTFRIRFDREALLANYKKQLEEKLKMDDLVPPDDALKKAKEAASNAIKAEVDSMQREYTSLFNKKMPGLDSIEDYTKKDLSSVFLSKLTGEFTKQIREKEAALKQLSEKINTGDEKSKERIGKLQKEIDEYYKLLAYYKKYQTLKDKLKIKDLNKKLSQETADRAKQYEKLLSDPESLKSLASTYLPLGGMENLFMSVQKLNAGQHTVSLSPLSLNNYLHNGVSLEIFKNNKYLFLLMGRQSSMNAIYDRAVFEPLIANDYIAKGIRLGVGPLNGNHTHLSFFSFRQNKALSGGRTYNTPSRSAMVVGLSKRYDIDESSSIEFEVSKSSAVYEDAGYGRDTVGRRSAIKNIFTGDFASTIAFMLKYRGNFPEIGLNVTTNAMYTAAGYHNPGSAYLARATKQGDLGLRKSFLKKKLLLNLKGNYREYAYGGINSSKWRNYSLLSDLMLKLKGGQQVGLRYQPVRGIQITQASRLMNSASDRLSADLNLQKRISRVFYRNALSTAYNRSVYMLVAGSNSVVKNVTFSSMQSIALNGHLIYWNNIYNHADNPSGLSFLNSTYNTDAGFTYQLTKEINMSSALNYTSATGWYKQLGARQTISGPVTKRIDFSFFIDARTNISQQAAYYDDLIRLDWSLKYNF